MHKLYGGRWIRSVSDFVVPCVCRLLCRGPCQSVVRRSDDIKQTDREMIERQRETHTQKKRERLRSRLKPAPDHKDPPQYCTRMLNPGTFSLLNYHVQYLLNHKRIGLSIHLTIIFYCLLPACALDAQLPPNASSL